MLSKQGYICGNIAEVTLLVVVLLKQYYSSYNLADSKCSSLKIIVKKISKNFRKVFAARGRGGGVIFLGGHVILKYKLKLHNTCIKRIFGITNLI